jgi:hypothetical protein
MECSSQQIERRTSNVQHRILNDKKWTNVKIFILKLRSTATSLFDVQLQAFAAYIYGTDCPARAASTEHSLGRSSDSFIDQTGRFSGQRPRLYAAPLKTSLKIFPCLSNQIAGPAEKLLTNVRTFRHYNSDRLYPPPMVPHPKAMGHQTGGRASVPDLGF